MALSDLTLGGDRPQGVRPPTEISLPMTSVSEMGSAEIRERLAAAIRSGDGRRIDEAVADWLAGLLLDEELQDHLEIETVNRRESASAAEGSLRRPAK